MLSLNYRFFKDIFSPVLSLVFFVLGTTLFTTFVSLRLKYLGFNDSDIGIAHAAFYGGYFAGSAYIGHFIYRVGHIRSFSTFASINIITVMIQAESSSLWVWTISRFFTGISVSALYCVVEGWLLSKSSIKVRGRVLALYMFALYFSQSSSQLFLDYVDVESQALFFYTGLLVSISILPLSITKSASPELSIYSSVSSYKLFQISSFGVSGCFFAGLMLSAVYSFTPLFASEYEIKVSQIMALTISGGFIFQWPIGKLSDIFDRRNVLITVCLLLSIPCIFLFFFQNEIFVLCSSFILGGFLFTIYPLSINQVCDRVAEHHIHCAVARLSLVYGLGAILGPLIVPFFIMHLSYPALYLYLFSAVVILLLLGAYAVRKRSPVPLDSQGEYVPAHPRITSLTTETIPTKNESS